MQKLISQSVAARWTVLIAVSLTMMCGYFITDMMAPLKSLLEQNLGWTSTDFGIFNSGYGWLNVMLLMLIVGGVILDKMGPRFTGVFATGVMLVGVVIKYYAIAFMPSDTFFTVPLFGLFKAQVLTASIGYAIFAFGYETFGITATKIVVRWFRGKGMAFALGMNVAFARLGTFLALAIPVPLAMYFGTDGVPALSMPILFCMMLLILGFLTFMVFVVMDRKLDKERAQEGMAADEKFRFIDIVTIFKMRGFWYIAMLCMLFYAAVFPFLKFASEFMVIKFGVEPSLAGLIPSLLPFGTLFLTPLFGGIYDKKGRGATIMLIGASLLVMVYVIFALPFINHWLMAVVLVLVLGIAFALVPSAMWPSVAKIIPDSKLGTAYAMIFWVQNIGLAGVPLLIGMVLDKYCIVKTADGGQSYNYEIPTLIFLCLGLAAVGFALLLKREDRIKGYGLEKPNIK